MDNVVSFSKARDERLAAKLAAVAQPITEKLIAASKPIVDGIIVAERSFGSNMTTHETAFIYQIIAGVILGRADKLAAEPCKSWGQR